MKDDIEVCQMVYSVLKTQIQFGAYRYGDILPTMEQAAGNFLVSPDTVRSSYLRLQKEGYLKLSQNVGTRVIKYYNEQEIECNIRQFFSPRKNALLDLSKSIRPLLGQAQWIGLKNAPAEIFGNLQHLWENDELHPFIPLKHIMAAYDSLGNDLLIRLIRQIFVFFEAAFFCVPQNPWSTSAINEYSPRTLDFCRKKEWEPLLKSICDTQDSLVRALNRFYEERIPTSTPQQEIPFTWSSYEKASQIRYSLAMDLLIDISRGQYPVDTLLPSLSRLSKERNVSVSTVRRALSLLNGVGAAESFKRIGTKVLPASETADHCDFTNPGVRRRLLDMAQSLQILTLSCREVSRVTITSLDASGSQKFIERLSTMEERRQYELVTYTVLELLQQTAPCQTIRTVYGELLRQLFWGYALRSIWKKSDGKVTYYRSCFHTFIHSLEETDAAGFSESLEKLMVHEFRFTIGNLTRLGIREAEGLLVPEL